MDAEAHVKQGAAVARLIVLACSVALILSVEILAGLAATDKRVPMVLAIMVYALVYLPMQHCVMTCNPPSQKTLLVLFHVLLLLYHAFLHAIPAII